MFQRSHFRLAEENHILKSQLQKPITNTYTLKYETLLPEIFNKLRIYCIFNHPEQSPGTIFCGNIQDACRHVGSRTVLQPVTQVVHTMQFKACRFLFWSSEV